MEKRDFGSLCPAANVQDYAQLYIRLQMNAAFAKTSEVRRVRQAAASFFFSSATRRPSGRAPSKCIVSLTTVRGTPCTRYLAASWGNSVASTISAVTRVLSSAILWAKLTALGQYGQVGVTKTCMWRGSFRPARKALVVSDRPESWADTSTMLSKREVNS